MGISVIRASERAATTTDWLTSRHSFSFGDHYDPYNTHHGSLLASNDEIVTPGSGFDFHAHQESEIVTWVVSGTLVHRDSDGRSGVVHPGLAQRMSAGSGIQHSERNDTWPDLPGSGEAPVRYIQMWVAPDVHGLTPSYEQADVSAALATGELVAVASGVPGLDAAVHIHNAGATLYAARLPAGTTVAVPAARWTHLFIVAGDVRVGTSPLHTGDALRATETPIGNVTAERDAEILIWTMRTDLMVALSS